MQVQHQGVFFNVLKTCQKQFVIIVNVIKVCFCYTIQLCPEVEVISSGYFTELQSGQGKYLPLVTDTEGDNKLF